MSRDDDPLVLGRIIGDVLDPFTGSISLRVVYNNQSVVINSCGFRPSQIVDKPIIDIGGDDLRIFYTLVYMHISLARSLSIVLLIYLLHALCR